MHEPWSHEDKETAPKGAQYIEGRLLTPKQAAEYLAVDLDTLRDMRRRRQIPFVRLSERRYRYEVLELQKWLAARRVPVL